MDQLPINLTVRGRKVVVVGAGIVAARKAELALRAGAEVFVVAPELDDEFLPLVEHARFRHRSRQAEPQDFAGALLAYVATGEATEDLRVRDLARAAGALVNLPDQPELCDFASPAILERAPLMLTVSSAGTSPMLTRLIREQLEGSIPATFGDLARFLGAIRDEVAAEIPAPDARRHFFERLLESPVADLVLAGDEPGARRLLAQELAAAADPSRPVIGEVYLVGGGPGDPDLLTFRAMRLLQRADVVVYDRLIGSPILNLVRRDAERIYVGKRMGDHELPQEEISQLLVTLARQGKRVLRLKGGDPFIFGRGGEEIELLADEGIPFQVVPGITAAAACAAYAGIPLTHRDHAQSCIFVTGHAKNGRPDLDWATLLQPHQTVAVYMGLAMLPALTEDFIAHGADPTTPVAIVDNGTRPNQRVITGTIADIAARAAEAGLKGPSMILIGSVVTLRDKLAWFRPDSGHSVDRQSGRIA
ncbi:MAG: siroheme synthase CysG [Phaeovulum sp.]|uniref:siroheme synthase CysG n=2 Tax=Phaeovulum sp. TaxID=2934796 RepID=UPI00272F25A7|nr:siroheme synthase CysG [Phaeovulum sp.]MDP2062431.1 siroheme synthase CysG [Phaeovulum sp.]